MPLDYADYARFYADSGMSEAEQRDDFEVHACFMDCLVRHYWRDEPLTNSLGISVDSDTISLLDPLDSDTPLTSTFNDAAQRHAAGKTIP